MTSRQTVLKDLPCGIDAEIMGIDGGAGIQSRLRALGLCEGKKVQKLCNVRLGGPVIIMIDRAQVAIGKRMAEKIIVRPLDAK